MIPKALIIIATQANIDDTPTHTNKNDILLFTIFLSYRYSKMKNYIFGMMVIITIMLLGSTASEKPFVLPISVRPNNTFTKYGERVYGGDSLAQCGRIADNLTYIRQVSSEEIYEQLAEEIDQIYEELTKYLTDDSCSIYDDSLDVKFSNDQNDTPYTEKINSINHLLKNVNSITAESVDIVSLDSLCSKLSYEIAPNETATQIEGFSKQPLPMNYQPHAQWMGLSCTPVVNDRAHNIGCLEETLSQQHRSIAPIVTDPTGSLKSRIFGKKISLDALSVPLTRFESQNIETVLPPKRVDPTLFAKRLISNKSAALTDNARTSL